MPLSPVVATDAPRALGPYSHAMEASGDFVILSGQTPVDPGTGGLVAGDFSAQVRQVFANLSTVLQAVGLTLRHAVKVNVYLTDMGDFPVMNEIYAQVFSSPYPARTTVAVAALPLGARIEVELMAVRA